MLHTEFVPRQDDVVTARDNESREYEVLHTAKKQKQKYAVKDLMTNKINRGDEEQKISSAEAKSCNDHSKVLIFLYKMFMVFFLFNC